MLLIERGGILRNNGWKYIWTWTGLLQTSTTAFENMLISNRRTSRTKNRSRKCRKNSVRFRITTTNLTWCRALSAGSPPCSRCSVKTSKSWQASRTLPGVSDRKRRQKNWMRRKFEQRIVVNTVLRAEKKIFCTGKDCILIDDNEQNIEEWEAAGGTGILFKDWSQVLDVIPEICAPFRW